MRLNELLIEEPVQPAQPGQPAKPSFMDKTLSGAAKVAGAIDSTTNFAKGVQNKIKGLGSAPDLFTDVSKQQVRSILNKIIKQEQLTPQEIADLRKFNQNL
jgi:methionyl-tRNA formyltransferase